MDSAFAHPRVPPLRTPCAKKKVKKTTMERERDKNGHLKAGIGERTAQPDIAALPAACDAVGNAFLAESPNKLLIQVSRRATPAEIAAKTEEALLFGNRGGVIVSGCISPGEQAVTRAVREAGLPLIAIIPRGFGPYFKPSGAYFDACADGKLLMLSPFPQITKTEKLTRERCFGINAVAAALCGEDPNAIRYRGSQPGQFTR